MKIPFTELLEQEDKCAYVRDKAAEKFDSFDSKAQDFFEIPKTWFVKEAKGKNGKVDQEKSEKSENWHGKLEIASNKYFTQFGIINPKKRLYLAFDNNIQYHPEDFTEYYSNLEMAKHHIPEHSQASHGRNQITKKFLYLTVRMANEGS